MDDFPKIIWMLWLQGWDNAPRIVQACRRSWELNNPDWTIQLLDQRNIAEFIENRDTLRALDPNQPPEACSDRLRIALLAQNGGIWADATTYCLRPLNDWVFDALKTGFFAFDRPGPDRLISSWFLAAVPNNYLIQRWAESTLEYWNGRAERDHYFWFHYLFGTECVKNKHFKAIYDQMPKLSADGPHYYVPQNKRLRAPLKESDKLILAGHETPLLKLSHKLRGGSTSEKFPIRFILKIYYMLYGDRFPRNSVAEYLCRLSNV
jgi:hypothetical protein